jgi:multidrug efflux system outer membrane protein
MKRVFQAMSATAPQKSFASFLQKRRSYLLFVSTLASGCTLAPAYHRPALPVAAAFPDGPAYHSDAPRAAPLAVSADELGWRDFFTDPRLRRLIDIALHANRDLRTAVIDVAQANAQFREQRAQLFPSISANGAAEYEGLPQGGLINVAGLGGSSSGTSGSSGSASASGAAAAIPTGSSGGGTFRYFSAGVGFASYELDLFGRLRSLSREEFEKFLAQRENRRAEQITVIANLANAYITWLADQALARVTDETLRTQQDSLALTQAEFDHGTTTLLTLREAQVSVSTAQANLAQYKRQVAQDENEIVLLIGAPLPADLPPANPLGAQTLLADLPPGLPSDLLTRRPDILQAEHTLRADNASIGAARAAFFPQILLTASGGQESLQFSKLFTAGAETWSFAPQLNIPIFTWGQNQANLDIAKTQRAIDVAAYEQTIQSAFHDVANALTARATHVDQGRAQQAEADEAADYYRLALMRFRAGVDPYLTTLDAQRTLYSAQQSLITAQSAQCQNLVTLYRSLGGGWAEHTRTAMK